MPNRRETSLHYAGWRVVVLCFVMAVLCWGLGFYGHGFYLAELKRQHGWPTALISSASTTCYLFSALLVIFISDAIRRFGVRAACSRRPRLPLGGSPALHHRALAIVCRVPGHGVGLERP